MPEQGLIVYPEAETHIKETLDKGCWTPTSLLGQNWKAELLDDAGSRFNVIQEGSIAGEVNWSQTGLHNVNNALATIAAAHHVGILPKDSIEALNQFEGVKRRMELISQANDIHVYDDFAHHPTAIKSTLAGVKNSVQFKRIWAVIEPRSNTMRMGVHKQALPTSVSDADHVIWFQPKGLDWQMEDVVDACGEQACLFEDIEAIIAHLVKHVEPHDAVVLMSNGGFQGIHTKLAEALVHAK